MSSAPLAGIRVVVTRASTQARALLEAFASAGAKAEALPLLEVIPPVDSRPLDQALDRLADFEWAIFTSVNAVNAVLPRIATWPTLVRVAAVGPATSAALEQAGVEVALAGGGTGGGVANAEGLLASLRQQLGEARTTTAARLFLPQAADARPELAAGLAAAGYDVVRVTAYEKRLPPDARVQAARLFDHSPIGWVTFSSPRIVANFAELFGGSWTARQVELDAASIGEVTSRALRSAGIEPVAEALAPGDRELVAAVERVIADRRYQPS